VQIFLFGCVYKLVQIRHRFSLVGCIEMCISEECINKSLHIYHERFSFVHKNLRNTNVKWL
jgi:hypothetical protein